MTAILERPVAAPPQQAVGKCNGAGKPGVVREAARSLGGITKALQASSNPVELRSMITAVASPRSVFQGRGPNGFTPIRWLPKIGTLETVANSNNGRTPGRTGFAPPD